MYQQKICYVDLYKNGLRCGNMGHVRAEWKDQKFRVQAYLCHLDRQTLATAILEKRTKSSTESAIEQRNDAYRNGMRLKDIEIIHGKGVYLSDWFPIQGTEERLIFEASGGVCGICHLPKMAEESLVPLPEMPQPGVIPQPTVVPQPGTPQPEIAPVPETVPMPEVAPRPKMPQPEMPSQPGSAPVPEVVPAPETVPTPGIPQPEIAVRPGAAWRPQELRDTKWEQLCSMFPRIRPIAGDIEFLQITPMDFVILRQEYQGLIRNSFLLHGYYNYNHLILGKYPDKYYIGVPGIMHEQERLAAAMFGFIGFEKAYSPNQEQKEKQGDEAFGYYMMEVGI